MLLAKNMTFLKELTTGHEIATEGKNEIINEDASGE